MAQKHSIDPEEVPHAKKQRSGFKVGPDNLPDGVHRRKVQKIKRELIDKAKLKKEYAKIKARELDAHPKTSILDPSISASLERTPSPTLEPHPDRFARLSHSNARSPSTSTDGPSSKSFADRRNERREKTRQHKANRKQNELQKLQSEVGQKREARELAEEERQKKNVERELWRRRVAKARRPGKDGQRKLGRESGLLLERVKKLVQGSGHTG